MPNLFAVGQSCRKKGGTDRQTHKGTLQLYNIVEDENDKLYLLLLGICDNVCAR